MWQYVASSAGERNLPSEASRAASGGGRKVFGSTGGQHGWLEECPPLCFGLLYVKSGSFGSCTYCRKCKREPHHEIQQPDGTHSKVSLLVSGHDDVSST